MRFCKVDEVEIITVSNGVFRQAAAYKRTEGKVQFIYAQYGSGFIRLYRNGATSSINVRWDETDLKHKFNSIGRMVL